VVRVDLVPTSTDLDLVVTGADPYGACDQVGDCIDASATAGDEYVEFDAIKGAVYYFIVDSPSGEAGTYSLSVTCP
jgi:hypothetical protein